MDVAADHRDYLPPRPASIALPAVQPQADAGVSEVELEAILNFIAARGFTFEPWQVAAYICAVRTKPFVILAGISGTGKSALPKLVADATGASLTAVPVRPDWHDSSELLGYERLDGEFRPGYLLRVAAEAMLNPTRQFFLLLDEMNIARPEYYLAEVLSRIEQIGVLALGEFGDPLRPEARGKDLNDLPWAEVVLPPNLAIIGSVNMDETTFGFSRKVLDRAFVIEFSDVDLGSIGTADSQPSPPLRWSAEKWQRTSATLARHPERGGYLVNRVVATLEELNSMLSENQLQVGYRVRDEIALFCLTAQTVIDELQTLEDGQIDALDLAISMKVLPRIQGSGVAITKMLEQLAEWAHPGSGDAPAFPLSSQRIALMRRRLTETGFTNYWM
jgi:5-methylcytosine-specific restriction endonuclease McrBC GTP-binding regulatory subunit McrB